MNSQVSLASTELERNPGRVNFFKIDENGRIGRGRGGGGGAAGEVWIFLLEKEFIFPLLNKTWDKRHCSSFNSVDSYNSCIKYKLFLK